jgi:hypothetical protein
MVRILRVEATMLRRGVSLCVCALLVGCATTDEKRAENWCRTKTFALDASKTRQLESGTPAFILCRAAYLDGYRETEPPLADSWCQAQTLVFASEEPYRIMRNTAAFAICRSAYLGGASEFENLARKQERERGRLERTVGAALY